eukprot:1878258-Rhodomonas_salina.4
MRVEACLVLIGAYHTCAIPPVASMSGRMRVGSYRIRVGLGQKRVGSHWSRFRGWSHTRRHIKYAWGTANAQRGP